mmetsp:Transcript_29904/g.85683  ORF Transcript_29904/g.85683 Transcript_29904/m.85683 type:complete len:227 (+) Transcript_29904:326-1006(+)
MPLCLVGGEEAVDHRVVGVVHDAEHLLHLRVHVAGEVAPEVQAVRLELRPAAVLQELRLLHPVAVVLDHALEGVLDDAPLEVPDHLRRGDGVQHGVPAALEGVLEVALLVPHARRAKGGEIAKCWVPRERCELPAIRPRDVLWPYFHQLGHGLKVMVPKTDRFWAKSVEVVEQVLELSASDLRNVAEGQFQVGQQQRPQRPYLVARALALPDSGVVSPGARTRTRT